MFYLRSNVEGKSVEIEIYDDQVFTMCGSCGKEISLTRDLLKGIARTGDFASTKVYCHECSDSESRFYPLDNIPTKFLVGELSRREGVSEVIAEPYQAFDLNLGGTRVEEIPDSGPARILVVWD